MKSARIVIGAVLVAVLVVGVVAADAVSHRGRAPSAAGTGQPTVPAHSVPLGAFLGSGAAGAAAVPGFQAWLGGPAVTVGHTYLPGQEWTDIEGDASILGPWSAWASAAPGRLLVLNVPMLVPNEAGLPDDQVAALLRQGAGGAFDSHFRVLAQRLVADHVPDTVVIPGWEMNGTTYTGRCGPDPGAWKAYWRQIVTTMRSVPGAAFRFDFDPDRGVDDIPWTQCYPGDDVVDIVGMDSYDQPPGTSFTDYVEEPYGLATQVDFAAAHHKPVSYPEWGLSDYGDDPAFVTGMYDWISTHNVVYETITDYCPHGVFGCASNPRSSAAYRALFGGHPAGSPP